MSTTVGKVERGVGLKKNTKVIENIRKETFETAGKMFVLLNFCPESVLPMADWMFFFENILDESIPLSDSILILNRLTTTENVGEDLKKVAYILLDKLREYLPLQHKNIEYLTQVDINV